MPFGAIFPIVSTFRTSPGSAVRLCPNKSRILTVSVSTNLTVQESWSLDSEESARGRS